MSIFDTPIKLSKHEARIIRWLLVAVDKTGMRTQLSLEGIKIGDKELVASNGFKIHTVNVEEVPPLEDSKGKVMTFNTNPLASECYVGIEETPGNYPDHDHVLKKARENEVAIEIGVNPKFLIEALRNLDDGQPVRLVFYHQDSAFEVNGVIKTGEKETKVQAVIMPMFLGKPLQDGSDDN